jgi:hypothetical protein
MKMMRNKSFAAFILTNGRPDKVVTHKALRGAGYTGRIVIVLDTDDPTADNYKKQFPDDKIVIFDKERVAKTFDEADNFNDRRAIAYARNYCFELAKEMGVKNFIQLDDDYTGFHYSFDHTGEYHPTKINDLDSVFDIVVDFHNSTKVHSVAMAQGGDFIGGGNNPNWKKKYLRKAMNTFFCRTDRPFKFLGRVNEDVTTYTHGASKGLLFFTIMLIRINQQQTQSTSGGMTEMYRESGTYVKSFYTVMQAPSSCKISTIPPSFRIHHSIDWRRAVPVLLPQEHKKGATK